jgi:dipeptidyl aminopeptidase/acylaminoacyl peptidase
VSTPTPTIEQLLDTRHPADVALSPDGRQLAVVVAGGAGQPGRAPAARLWLGPLGGTLRQVMELDCTDGVPRWSPSGAELAIASDREHRGRMSLYIAGPAAATISPLGRIGGSVEEIAWAADGSSLIVLAADLGLETAGALNAVLIADTAQAAPDPVVLPGPPALRRLYQVDRASGATREIHLGGLNAWDFSWDGAGTLAAIVSAGSGESDWYTAAIAVYQLAGGTRQVAGYQPRWQLGVPRLAPGGQRLAFLEGVCSDRGILAGELMVAGISPGDLDPRPLGPDNVQYLEWRDDESLLYAAADGVRSVIGTAGTGAGGAVVWRGDRTLGDGYHVRTSSDAAGRRVVAVTEGASGPPEVACLPLGGDTPAAWTRVTDFNAGLDPGPPPSWEPVTWTCDGHQIEGLLVLPPGRAAERLPLVVLLHGGPTWGWGYQWSNADFPVLWAAAGYAVLMPNPRQRGVRAGLRPRQHSRHGRRRAARCAGRRGHADRPGHRR